MTRKEELLEMVGNKKELLPLVEDMVFLEKQLEYLRALPFIQVHPDNPSKQRTLPAKKDYKDLLQQYVSVVRTFESVLDVKSDDNESPLRAYFKK